MAKEGSKELNGVRKSAILLLTLPQDQAAAVMQRLSKEQIEEVSREIASMGNINGENRNLVFKEFYNMVLANNYVAEGGLDYAKALLKKSMPEGDADKMIKQVTQQVATTPFAFLQKAESENLLTFIQDEHPQTIALILAHLNPTKASEILVGLPNAKQVEVVKRIANMEQTNPEVIKRSNAAWSIASATLSARPSRKPAASIRSPKCSTWPTARPRKGSWKASRPRIRTWSSRSAG